MGPAHAVNELRALAGAYEGDASAAWCLQQGGQADAEFAVPWLRFDEEVAGGCCREQGRRLSATRTLKRMQLGACAGAFSRWVEAAGQLRAEREQAEAAAQRAAVEDARKLAVLGRDAEDMGPAHAVNELWALAGAYDGDASAGVGVCSRGGSGGCCVCAPWSRLRGGERVFVEKQEGEGYCDARR